MSARGEDDYLVLIARTPRGYGFVIPDLSLCCGTGASERQALVNAHVEMQNWLTASDRKRLKRPAARSEAELLTDPTVRESVKDGAYLKSLRGSE